MICVDTTVLIDEFRARGNPEAPVNRALLAHATDTLLVPVVAVGEFLDGAAMVSDERFVQAVAWLQRRRSAGISFDCARLYGKIVSQLRRGGKLSGRSHNDLWIAAIALQCGAALLTRNAVDFDDITGLRVLAYG